MEKETTKFNISAKKSRRDFLIKGAKVAPVITAVAAAPVWATSNANSGNQSGGMSQTTTVTKFNGYSPGYYHEHTSNGNGNGGNTQCEELQGSSKLPQSYYNLYYGGPGGVFPHSQLNVQVRHVLNPSHWQNGGKKWKGDENNGALIGVNVTQVDRYMLTAWLNADDIYGPIAYPYSQAQVVQFCKDYEQGLISYSDAKEILGNLIHEGQEDSNVDEPTGCTPPESESE